MPLESYIHGKFKTQWKELKLSEDGNILIPGVEIIDGITALTTNAIRIVSDYTVCRGVEVTAHILNTDYILIGNETSQNKILYAGESLYFAIDDISKIWAKSHSGSQNITYLGVK